MVNLVWLILLLSLTSQFLSVFSQDTSGWLFIDCGTNGTLGANLIPWRGDSEFAGTGTSMQVQQTQTIIEMNTLRLFPSNSQSNCYILPVYPQTVRYLIRAGFYYGNYDGHSMPPTFDLYINHEKWATVNTSAAQGGPVYEEVIYVNHGLGNVSVCLVQIRDGEVPFISSLEATPFWMNLYPQMETNVTFHLVNRTNFGGNEVRYTGLITAEKYNRIWSSGPPLPNSNIIPSLAPPLLFQPDHDPPIPIFTDSIQSSGPSDPIILTLDLQDGTPQAAYLAFYFTESTAPRGPDDIRIIDIFINGQITRTVSLDLAKCTVITLYPIRVVGPMINITLGPNQKSTLPPLIGAMEAFTRKDVQETSGSGGGAGGGNSSPNSNALDHIFSAYNILIHILCFLVFLK